jgi:hypothetical protein
VVAAFETAKNLSLYACFVHDFHSSACLAAFVALELSLKEKWRVAYKREPDGDYKMLKGLLAHAIEKKWIRIEAFSWARFNAKYNARVKALNALYLQFPQGGFEPPVVSDAEIERELATYGSWVADWADSAKELRNDHAHGNDRTDVGRSHGPLMLVADAINGMFV